MHGGKIRKKMKAMILCAGFGTRLGDLTKETPKPMLCIHGKPILEHILLHLKQHDVSDVMINLHFMPDSIVSYFGTGSRYGLRINYSFEDALLGTAGGLKKAESFFKDKGAFLVHYGDILTNQDFSAMHQFHKDKNATITMLVHARQHSNSIVLFDENNRITQFLERPSDEERKGIVSTWVNSGICICEPEIFDVIPSDGVCDLPRDVFAQHVSSIPMFAYPLSGIRYAIDSPQRLAQAAEAFKDGKLGII
jgi:NDP-sugar pyrophosphorylase family protein